MKWDQLLIVVIVAALIYYLMRAFFDAYDEVEFAYDPSTACPWFARKWRESIWGVSSTGCAHRAGKGAVERSTASERPRQN